MASLGVPDWDVVIVGDGSGSSRDRAAGWASWSCERAPGRVERWFGAANRGTVNFAEVMAYLQPLTAFSGAEADRREKGRTPRVCRVHVVTDSKYVRDTGASEASTPLRNVGPWAAIRAFSRQGFLIRWHWIARGTDALNEAADELSRRARLAIEAAGREAS